MARCFVIFVCVCLLFIFVYVVVFFKMDVYVHLMNIHTLNMEYICFHVCRNTIPDYASKWQVHDNFWRLAFENKTSWMYKSQLWNLVKHLVLDGFV